MIRPADERAGRLVLEVVVSPEAHGVDDGLCAPSMVAERVLDARRHLGIDAAVDQASGLELAQGAGEHLVGHVRDESLQIAEPPCSAGEPVEDDQVPPSAQDFQSGRQRAWTGGWGRIFGVRR